MMVVITITNKHGLSIKFKLDPLVIVHVAMYSYGKTTLANHLQTYHVHPGSSMFQRYVGLVNMGSHVLRYKASVTFLDMCVSM